MLSGSDEGIAGDHIILFTHFFFNRRDNGQAPSADRDLYPAKGNRLAYKDENIVGTEPV